MFDEKYYVQYFKDTSKENKAESDGEKVALISGNGFLCTQSNPDCMPTYKTTGGVKNV